MKPFRLITLLLALLLTLFLPGCSKVEDPVQKDNFHITVTTYPLYALTSAITAGVERVEVGRLNTGSVSCLHDYTLTISDMRQIEQADLIVINGAGLETFLDRAFRGAQTTLLDCSQTISLFEFETHEHHDEEIPIHSHEHDHEHDPHYWMDPRKMIAAANTIARTLSAADPENAKQYESNLRIVSSALQNAYNTWSKAVSELSSPRLITFHDGFYYFAEAFGMEILFSMEEENGATASARDIAHAAKLVKDNNLSVIFAEANGSGSAAKAVSGETGVSVAQLSLLMAGEDAPEHTDAEDILNQLYILPMNHNIEIVLEVLK